MVERVVSQGYARGGAVGGDLGPDDARALLRSWLDSIGLAMSDAELLAWMQSDALSHADLFRRARRVHERRLRGAVHEPLAAAESRDDLGAAQLALFEACVPTVPYAPSAAFLGREQQKLSGPARFARRDLSPRRAARELQLRHRGSGIGGGAFLTDPAAASLDRGVVHRMGA
jgi:hypothetical protein